MFPLINVILIKHSSVDARHDKWVLDRLKGSYTFSLKQSRHALHAMTALKTHKTENNLLEYVVVFCGSTSNKLMQKYKIYSKVIKTENMQKLNYYFT